MGSYLILEIEFWNEPERRSCMSPFKLTIEINFYSIRSYRILKNQFFECLKWHTYIPLFELRILINFVFYSIASDFQTGVLGNAKNVHLHITSRA